MTTSELLEKQKRELEEMERQAKLNELARKEKEEKKKQEEELKNKKELSFHTKSLIKMILIQSYYHFVCQMEMLLKDLLIKIGN